MKILVVIASYGTANDRYLHRLIEEYRSMPFDLDIVVLSEAYKAVPPGTELVVGLTNKNPWSLPFGHKKILADRLADYDLFIYSEDDILITERNVQAFLQLSVSLPDDEIPGFLRFEKSLDGTRNYPDFHAHFRWAPGSLRLRDGHTLAFFTNEHSACYMLTRQQLQRAIESGGFLVGPHTGKYDLACTAATDPYTQCGLQKLICISQLDDFAVHHLPDKYVGKVGLKECEFLQYLQALLRTQGGGDSSVALINTETKVAGHWYSKDYYEPVRKDLVSIIPDAARTVLSVGCGWGATEECLARSGRRVVALPLDSVMSTWAESRGVEVVRGNLTVATQKVAHERFDCLLVCNVLHLVEDPAQLLSSFAPLLSGDSVVIASIPRISRFKVIWRKIRQDEHFKLLGRYEKAGMHVASRAVVRKWFRKAGLKVDKFADLVPMSALAAPEILAVGKGMRKTHAALESPLHGQQRRSKTLAQYSR